MWITHPQTGKCMRTDESIKVRCDDCLRRNPATKPGTNIKIVRVGNRDRLVCEYHLTYYSQRRGDCTISGGTNVANQSSS